MNVNLANVELKISCGFLKQFPADRKPQIALSGRSNVGKSSFINTVLGRKSLARVSGTPGKTVTVNFYEVDKKFYLVDLPGYGFAKRAAENKAAWSSLTDGYFTRNPARDCITLVVQLIDMKVGPTDDDRMMIDYLRATGIPFTVVATKTDKLNKTDRAKAVETLMADPMLAGVRIIPFSSLTGEGKADALSVLLGAAGA